MPSLTTEDLKDLGVSLVGHRRRLLDAIAVLSSPLPNPPPLAGREGWGRMPNAGSSRLCSVISSVDGARRAARPRGSARGHR